MRTVWKGTLSFGLVTIPVKLASTTRRSGVSFRQLHGEDQAPIRNERRCTACGEAVDYDELVKGAEVGDDTYVVVTEEELERAEPESSNTIRVREFVPLEDIDRVYVDRTYALMPREGGERAYALFHDALDRRGEAAIGQLAMRRREYVVAVRAGRGRVLFGDILHYQEEVRDLGEMALQVGDVGEITAEEMDLADALIERMTRRWDPSRYEDHYTEALRELVAAKARGEAFVAPERHATRTTEDLLDALRRTLEEGAGEDDSGVAEEA